MMNYLLCKESLSENELQVKAAFVNFVEAELFANNYYKHEYYCIFDMNAKAVVVNKSTLSSNQLYNILKTINI